MLDLTPAWIWSSAPHAERTYAGQGNGFKTTDPVYLNFIAMVSGWPQCVRSEPPEWWIDDVFKPD